MFIDGLVIAVPEARKADYLDYARRCWELFREVGVTGMQENWGSDVPEGKLTSFPMAVKREPGEAVVFSWLIWPDRATRDAGFKALESDPRMAELGAMPFDGKRMIFGGFETVFTA